MSKKNQFFSDKIIDYIPEENDVVVMERSTLPMVFAPMAISDCLKKEKSGKVLAVYIFMEYLYYYFDISPKNTKDLIKDSLNFTKKESEELYNIVMKMDRYTLS